MHTSDFHYDLPADLIAQYATGIRSASRLLCLDKTSGSIQDRRFTDLPALLSPDDLLVFNDTRVIPARLRGVKASGGRVEVLVERLLDRYRVLALVRASQAPRPGTRLWLEDAVQASVIARQGEFYELGFAPADPVLDVLEAHGHTPLPPYIARADDPVDRSRYQTVYADKPGAVAAPTAGLHFDVPLLQVLSARGVEQAFITLHVGAGTFQPVRVDDPREHRMHAEYAEVTAGVCEAIRRCRARGGRVVAVGTTTVRSLEAAARKGECEPFNAETELFITPGYAFRVVDAMITNFHLPESTLLMLVCAFGGYRQVMNAYRHAVAGQYRFYSYGDAMFITASGIDIIP